MARIDAPIGSLVVIDGTICEVVIAPHPSFGCASCVLEKCPRCTPEVDPFECWADHRQDNHWVIFRPIDVD